MTNNIVELNSDVAVSNFVEDGGELLYFTAKWCSPCSFYAPLITSIATETDALVGKINVDLVQDALVKYNIRAVPTIVKLDADGNQVQTETGVRDDEFVRSFFA